MPRALLRWLPVALLALAAFGLRSWELSSRPMHADEANQAVKAGELVETGRYAFDPHEHHGPTLYYAAWVVGWCPPWPGPWLSSCSIFSPDRSGPGRLFWRRRFSRCPRRPSTTAASSSRRRFSPRSASAPSSAPDDGGFPGESPGRSRPDSVSA